MDFVLLIHPCGILREIVPAGAALFFISPFFIYDTRVDFLALYICFDGVWRALLCD